MRPDHRAPLISELPLHGEWSRPESPLARCHPVAADVHWTSAARRITLTGSAAAGLKTVESGAIRLSSEPVGAAAPPSLEPDHLLVTPSEAHRIFRGDSGRHAERWIAALDLPVAFWELDVPDTLAFAKRWWIHTDRSVVTTTIDSSGRVATAAGGDAGHVVFALDGGRLEWGPAEPGAAMVAVAGSGRVRLMIVIAADDSDLERTLGVVTRRGFAGLRAQRVQHERLLREYGAALSTPLPRLDSQFEWAKALADEQARASRSVAAAEALLGVGLRDGARELLKAGCGALAGSWKAWAGDRAASGGALAGAAPFASAADPPGDAPDAAAELPPDRLLRWVTTTLWGIVPDAPGQAVSLAPRLPAGWTRVSLARIRVGTSAIDCDLRARGGALIVRARRASGPPLTVTIAPFGIVPRGISVDGIELAGGRARFEAVGEHEVVFELAA